MTVTAESMTVVGGRQRGRPPRASRRSTKRVEFMVTEDEHRILERVAEQSKQPIASVIRQAVDEFVSDYGEKKVFSS